MDLDSGTVLAVALAMPMAGACADPPDTEAGPVVPSGFVDLPDPEGSGTMPLEATLERRRSLRDFTDEALTVADIGKLLWAAQGVTSGWGARTAPSAGALYPLEMYVVTAQGLFHYRPEDHRLEVLGGGDLRRELAAAGLDQSALRDAPAVFVMAAVYRRTEAKYGGRAERYVQLEAGHAAQNLLLEAVALDLGAVPIGAFYDDEAAAVLGLPADHQPLYLIPVGRAADG